MHKYIPKNRYRCTMKNLIQRLLPQSWKNVVKGAFGTPIQTIHTDWSILETVPSLDESHIVFDLGARNGWFVQCWLGRCPNSVIHAFEAEPNAAKSLTTTYSDDARVILCSKGVGAKSETKTFYRLRGSEVSSSFLEHDKSAWDAIKYKTGDIEQQQVELVALDDYCEQHKITKVYLMKIDIQGFELEALHGAQKIIETTNYLLIESAITPLYKDSATFTQVHDLMRSKGFHLMNWRAWHRGNRVLMETDMLFRRNGLEELVPDHTEYDRYYIGG